MEVSLTSQSVGVGRAIEKIFTKEEEFRSRRPKSDLHDYDSKEMASSEVFLTVKTWRNECWIKITHN